MSTSTKRIYVPANGPKNAKIVFIGEAPGKDEENHRENGKPCPKPFVGYSGQFMRERVIRVGMVPNEIYITNVCKFRPPYNKIQKFVKSFGDGKKNTCNELVLAGIIELYCDLAEIQPIVIVPFGNMALWSLTGHMKIASRRGSILKVVPNLNLFNQIHKNFPKYFDVVVDAFKKIEGTKVIPSIHPASITRQLSMRPIFDFDLQRIYEEAATRTIELPQRTYYIDPPQEQAIKLADTLLASPSYSVDIECLRGTRQIYCVGYSCDPSWSLTLRMDEQWKRELNSILLTSPARKTFQNGMFDCWYLRVFEGIEVENYWHDIMIAQRIAYPELPMGLDFQTSLQTREPYYKDEGKEWDPKEAEDVHRFLTYNGKDCAVTKEIELVQFQDELSDPNVLCQVEHKMKLMPIVIDMETDGILIDQGKMRDLQLKYTVEGVQLQKKLDTAVLLHLKNVSENTPPLKARCLSLAQKIAKAGGFNVGSTGEGNIVDEYLYGIRQFKPKYKPITGKRTTDEESMKELYGETGDPIILTIVKKRKNDKLLNTELSVKVDDRSRTYFAVNPHKTKTGRWSFTNNILGYGCNGQAWHPKAKEVVVADPGYVWFDVDLAQVEDRIVAYYGHVSKKIWGFENNIDGHALTASLIFGGTIEEIIEEDRERQKREGKQGNRRYMGKQSNHAFNYGEGPFRFAKSVNKRADETGIRISNAKAKKIRTAHLRAYPEIEENYWQEIEGRIKRDHYLINPFGWKRTFRGPYSDEVMRDGYSWIPQSTAPHIIDLGMLAIRKELPQVKLVLHGHDSIKGQMPIDEAEDLKPEIVKLMTIPLEIKEQEIIVPVDIKIGPNWKDLKK